VVGNFGVARAADAPLLGSLRRHPDAVTPAELVILKKGVGLAAAASSIEAVELVAAGPQPDLTLMAAQLAGTNNLVVRPYSANGVHRNGHRTGVVVVAPSMLSREGMVDVSNLQAITNWPVLGVITYPAETAGQRLRRMVASVKAQDTPRRPAAAESDKDSGEAPRKDS
jgi:hypothetical protein